MKKLTIIVISIVMSLQMTKAQDAESLFKTAFPELTDFNYSQDNELTKAQIAQYRSFYDRLKTTNKQLNAFAKGGGTEENMTIFSFKELKKIEKENQVPKLQELTNQNLENIKKYLATKTKYGADSLECLGQLSILKQSTKKKDYKIAFNAWKILFNYYPLASKNIYLSGKSVLTSKIKTCLKEAKKLQKEGKKIIKDAEPLKGKDVAKYNAEIDKANQKFAEIKPVMAIKDQWVDTLMMMYDKKIKYFGESKQYGEGYIIGEKGIALFKYQKGSKLKEAYELLKESAKLQENYPSITELQYYFFAADALYAKQGLEADQVVEDYGFCQDIIAKYIEKIEGHALKKPSKKAKFDKQIKNSQKVADNITTKFTKGEYARCDVLVPTFSAKFEENKNDIQWLKKTVAILIGRKGEDSKICLESKLFEDLIIQLYTLEPSAKSAKFLAEFNLKKATPNYDEAARYYEEAYKLETDSTLKADYYYSAAIVASEQGQLSKVRTLAQKALDLNPNLGKAYILIGKQYVKSVGSCGEDNFEKSMVYWLAADMMLKAKKVDPELSAEANKLIAAYSKKFPRKEEAFMRSIKPGNSITIGCWIQRTTTARFIQ